jgi:hypothetical protein
MRPIRPERLAGLYRQPEEPVSHLLLNIPGAQLGVRNILDLHSHEIIHRGGQRIHRLTFNNGECLHIETDGRTVSVEGARINFDSDAQYPEHTWLADPEKPSRQRWMP